MRDIGRSILVWASLALAGCASSLVGLQSDGTYILESSEQSWSCDALQRNLAERVEVLKLLPAKAKAEHAEAPQTALSLIGRWMSSGNKGLTAIAEYDRERAHAFAMQRAMHEKKCPPVDIDRDLAEADAEIRSLRGK